MSDTIGIEDFHRVDLRIGTVRSARPNLKARKPAYVLEIDFGPELGIKTTSAQITEAYDTAALEGRQVVAVVNFPRKKIADVWSEVLVLGATGEGPTILIAPDRPVPNGSHVA